MIEPAAEALPIAALVVSVPAPLASLSALIVIAPVVVAPIVPPLLSVMLLSASREINPEPESIAALVVILLPTPVAVKVAVPLPFAVIAWLTVSEHGVVTAMLPLDVVVNDPFKVTLPLPV